MTDFILTVIIILLLTFLLYIFVMLFHEGGHWLVFKILGHDAKIYWNFWKDTEIGIELHKKITLKQSVIIAVAGIFAGLLPIHVATMFVSLPIGLIITFSYVFMCFGDLYTIFTILQERDWSITMYDLNKKHWKTYKRYFDGSG